MSWSLRVTVVECNGCCVKLSCVMVVALCDDRYCVCVGVWIGGQGARGQEEAAPCDVGRLGEGGGQHPLQSRHVLGGPDQALGGSSSVSEGGSHCVGERAKDTTLVRHRSHEPPWERVAQTTVRESSAVFLAFIYLFFIYF